MRAARRHTRRDGVDAAHDLLVADDNLEGAGAAMTTHRDVGTHAATAPSGRLPGPPGRGRGRETRRNTRMRPARCGWLRTKVRPGGSTADGVALCMQVRVVEPVRVVGYVGELNDAEMMGIKQGLAAFFGLEGPPGTASTVQPGRD